MPLHFDLRRQSPSKTIDVGHNGTSVSADPLGRILQLSSFHPDHGMVLASPHEQFDGLRFHDPIYVRKYRSRMLNSIKLGQPGFGLRFEGDVSDVSIDLQSSRQVQIRYSVQQDVSVSTTLHIRDDGELIQKSTICSTAPTSSSVRYILDLGLSINRASYGQLTEGGPIPLPQSVNELQTWTEGTTFTVVNPNLSTNLCGRLELDGMPLRLDDDIRASIFRGRPIVASSARVLEIPPNMSRSLTARFRLRPTTAIDVGFQERTSIVSQVETKWKAANSDSMFIVRRNLEYILGNCAIPVTAGAVALITDHVALPLGWNRDNYWQVRFLLDVYQNINKLADCVLANEYREKIRITAKGHINWVFRLAERPQHFWHRSYLVTGRPKDGPVFQLDQQCYPLLELCDFLTTFPEEVALVQAILDEDTVAQVLDLLETKRDPETGLYATEETPGDDAVEFPFHFSSQILLWHTFSQMSRLVQQLGDTRSLKVMSLSAQAEAIRRSTLANFLSVRGDSSKQLFAYIVDGHGQKTFYHDANDIPTLFAVEWGFLRGTAEIEAWKNTMDFALSKANAGGYYVGGSSEFGGLGSVHTRAPWPLGYLQEFLYASATGNASAEQDAWRRIRAARQWDGLFSEAVDIETARCTSKAWFSWPGSMIGSALLRPELRERYLISLQSES